MQLQPFEKHPASPAGLRETGAELRRRAAETTELAAATRAAYAPAVDHWRGLGAAEMAAAGEPVQRGAQEAHQALLWSAAATDYWATRVEGFNAHVDAITAGLARQAAGDYGATGTGGHPPTPAQVDAALGAATAAARQQWMQAYDTYIDAGRHDVAAMLRQGPTREHLATLREAGVLPERRAAPPRAEGDDSGWSWSDIGHGALDVAGLVPFVGEVADGANATWYAAEGDYTNAALSAAAMVPFAGWAATGGKLGIKGVKAVRSADGARAFVKGRPSMVPRHAQRVPFTPNQKFPHGERYRWTDPETGKKVQYHAHGRDPDRPSTENAGQGPIYRVQVGNHYLDAQGNPYTRNAVENTSSKAFNPQAANDTHIPYPKDQPAPDRPHVRVAAPNPAGLAGPDGDQR